MFSFPKISCLPKVLNPLFHFNPLELFHQFCLLNIVIMHCCWSQNNICPNILLKIYPTDRYLTPPWRGGRFPSWDSRAESKNKLQRYKYSYFLIFTTQGILLWSQDYVHECWVLWYVISSVFNLIYFCFCNRLTGLPWRRCASSMDLCRTSTCTWTRASPSRATQRARRLLRFVLFTLRSALCRRSWVRSNFKSFTSMLSSKTIKQKLHTLKTKIDNHSLWNIGITAVTVINKSIYFTALFLYMLFQI